MKQTDSGSNVGSAAKRLGLSASQTALFDEFEKLMALNTLVDRATADLPILWALVGRTGDTEALNGLITEAITELPAPQRQALTCLFTDDLGSGSGNLTGRKRRAARILGKPYNTARARRDGNLNDFDLLVISLIRSVHSGEPEIGSRTDLEGEPHTPVDSTSVASTDHGRFRLVPLSVGAGVLLVAVVIFAVLLGSNGDDSPGISAVGAADSAPTTITDPDPAAPRPGVGVIDALGEAQVGRIPDCDRPIGGPLVPAIDNVWITSLMFDAYQKALDGGFDLACPVATAQQWGAVWFQPIDGADPSQDGTIVVSGPGPGTEGDSEAVFLPKTIWLAYHNVGLDGGVSAQSLAGFPTEFSVDDEGHWIARTSLGDLIIAEQPNTSGRWIPHQAVPVWESYGGIHGELGLPMTNVEYVDGLITQTYEHGKAFVGLEGVIEAEIYGQAAIDTDLAALPRSTDGILSTYDSTDWWIDSEGVRHWIPSGPDHDDGVMWECLGGLDNTIAEGVNGWVIAAFPLGDNATCPAA